MLSRICALSHLLNLEIAFFRHEIAETVQNLRHNQFLGDLFNKARERNTYGLYYSPVEITMQQQLINMQYYHILPLKELLGKTNLSIRKITQVKGCFLKTRRLFTTDYIIYQ